MINNPTLVLSVATGALVVAGLAMVLVGTVRTHPRLGDVLGQMDGNSETEAYRVDPGTLPRWERWGLWVQRHTPLGVSGEQARLLELRDKSVHEFFADKLIMGLCGAFVPGILGLLAIMLAGVAPFLPAGLVLVGAIVGWFTPDVLLRRESATARAGAGEALFTYFDLVTLERLANLSGSQSLHSAAALSDAPLFQRIRAALVRARLEQQPPYAELKRLAERLRIPELGDIADVMRMDEQGAALSGTLRARVRELRDAHLTASKVAAHETSERMTVYMVIPAMIFGLIYLVPPLMKLMGVA